MVAGCCNQSLLAIKLHIPQSYARGVVARQRLHTWLDMAVSYPITLISAPVGFGKTTLVSTWLQQSDKKACWLSLEHNENDLLRFWSYCIAAFERTCPGVSREVMPLLDTWPVCSIEDVLAALINVLMSLPEEILLVLDDYHTIEAHAIHRSLTFFLEHLPPQVHVLLSTRVDPPLPMARFFVHGRMIELQADDLRFSLEETTHFLREGMGLDLQSDKIMSLMTCTEGWIAGLQLAALSLQDCEDMETINCFIASFTGTNRYVLNYLTEEILARVPDDMRTFLLATSILERMNASLCDAVTGQKNGESMLERLNQANLFLVHMDEQGTWYHYHHLFADLLRYRLSQQGMIDVLALHLRASHWFEREQMMTLAVKHALEAQAWERAANLIEQVGWSFWCEGRMETLYDWLEQLRGHVELKKFPFTAFLLAIIYLYHGQTDKYHQALYATYDYWQGVKNMHMLCHIANLQAYAALFHGDGTPVIFYVLQALTQAQNQPISYQGMSHVFLGAGYLLYGDTPQALIELTLGQRIGQQYKQTMTIIGSAFYMGELYYARGDLNDALRYYQQCINEGSGRMIWHQVQAYFRIGNIYYEWNDLTLAEEHLHQGTLLAGHYLYEHINVDGNILSAQVARAHGLKEQAHCLLDRAERNAQLAGHRLQIARINQLRVRYLLADEKPEVALRRMEGICPQKREPMSHLERELWDQIEARLLLAQGNSAEAIQILLGLLPQLKQQGRGADELPVQLLLAQAYFDVSDIRLARQHFISSLKLAMRGQFRHTFLSEGRSCIHLLGELYRRPWKRLSGGESHSALAEYMYMLMREFGLGMISDDIAADPKKIQYMQPLQDQLSGRELEVLKLIAAGNSNQQIAQTLVVAESTIKTHLNNIYSKLHVKSRLQALTKAHGAGLLL